jgi:hypothetical protein
VLALLTGYLPASITHAHPLGVAPKSLKANQSRAPRSVVQSCMSPYQNEKRAKPVLGGGKFIRRFARKHTDSYLRGKAERSVALSGCIHGSFLDRETVKIMLLADGYTDSEQRVALKHIETVGAALTSREPFNRYRKLISICYKVVPAAAPGVSTLGTEPNCAGVGRAICANPSTVNGFSTMDGKRPHVTGVLYNSEEYYGASQYWDGIFTISRNSSVGTFGLPQYYWLAVHEFLHTCCSSPTTPILRRYPSHQISRFDYKIQDEYPVNRFQCHESKSFNLGKANDIPWSYLQKEGEAAHHSIKLDGAFCAYTPTESSIMSTLRNPEVNLPTQAGWIRQALGSIRTVVGIRLDVKGGESKKVDSRIVLEGPERLPFPVIDWFLDGKERVLCKNQVACSLRKLGAVSGAHKVSAKVGVADPALNFEELGALTDEISIELSPSVLQVAKGRGRIDRHR